MVSSGNLQRRICGMNTLEVLTLVLVIFTALAYLDNHQKENSYPLLAIEDSL